MAYYCSNEYQAFHSKRHRPDCQDRVAETDYEIDLARTEIVLGQEEITISAKLVGCVAPRPFSFVVHGNIHNFVPY
ncbi:BQ2448_149 [Microbotryum intermedium]|uniref:BQ2448_149 protein n=1 Tax=Microbotryum intermedium TaxID=269621 RepID=A0A238FA78_9BASI|nr:BQ2448_149 [Microbotryum intermedium]